jgi:ATP-binding cassette subfamily B protein
LLDTAQVPARRRAAVGAAMLRERLAGVRIGGCRVLRLPASAGYFRQLAHARLPRRVLGMLGVFACMYVLEFAGWGLIGDAVLGGRLDMGWMAAWLLLMLSMIPLRLLGGWLDANFALDAGRILKSRLLAGALRMDMEAVRRQGVGHLLGRVMESQALESLALNGGMGVLVAMIELLFAAWILWLGAGGGLHALLLVGWLALAAWGARRYYVRLRDWTLLRLSMTHDLIERMVGHRTRLAQETPARRDAQEDQAMKAYLDASRALDLTAVPVTAGIPAGWMVIGVAGLVPAFVAGGAAPALLAISLGGIMVAQRAFGAIVGGLAGLSRAAIAWGQVAELFHAARHDGTPQPFLTTAQMRGAGAGPCLVDANGLTFRYQAAGEPVLRGACLSIGRGERLLLEGASGGGKSTLASLLAGLRDADSGLLLLNGLDRHTLGDNWHRLATEAPQFHENHVLSGSFGFNLLLGREWPAPDEDLDEAEALCRELGLGPLLDRMPSGMQQRVGETGWQLSHGERSRLFLARALLQKAQLTIMDESFAALDPETLAKCMQCAIRHDTTLMVIAHP